MTICFEDLKGSSNSLINNDFLFLWIATRKPRVAILDQFRRKPRGSTRTLSLTSGAKVIGKRRYGESMIDNRAVNR